jgi:hypothetical protein
MPNNKIAQLSNPYNSKRRLGEKGKERASHHYGVASVSQNNCSNMKLMHDPPYMEEVTTHHHHDDMVEGRRKPPPSWGINDVARNNSLEGTSLSLIKKG